MLAEHDDVDAVWYFGGQAAGVGAVEDVGVVVGFVVHRRCLGLIDVGSGDEGEESVVTHGKDLLSGWTRTRARRKSRFG